MPCKDDGRHHGSVLAASLPPNADARSVADSLGILRDGRLLYLDGGLSLDALVLRALAAATERGGVLVLDGGNSLDVFRLAEAARRLRLDVGAVLSAVRVARGFTVHQYAALLDDAPNLVDAKTRLVVASAFPEMYLDEDVGHAEGRVLARRGAEQLLRLARETGAAIALTNRARPLTPHFRDLLRTVPDEVALVTPAGAGGALVHLLREGRVVAFPLEGRQRLLSEFVSSREAPALRVDDAVPSRVFATVRSAGAEVA